MHGKTTPRISRDHDALGAAVRETRARRGVSQEALGDASGLHRNLVGALERGELNPTFRTLLTLTGGLGITLSALIVLYERNVAESIGACKPL
jgi:transcriptional regulator with XRE-family HTH domain